jgi:hypothetical protein
LGRFLKRDHEQGDSGPLNPCGADAAPSARSRQGSVTFFMDHRPVFSQILRFFRAHSAHFRAFFREFSANFPITPIAAASKTV